MQRERAAGSLAEMVLYDNTHLAFSPSTSSYGEYAPKAGGLSGTKRCANV